MKIAIVVPTYNEIGNIPLLVESLFAVQIPFDLLVVDDNSPDGTGALLESLRPIYPPLRVIHRSGKAGLGTAYREAFYALLKESKESYDLFITMDADLSHSPESVPHLVRAAEGAELVIGSRYIPGGEIVNWSSGRQTLSRVANCIARRMLGLKAVDITSGFRCYHRELIAALERLDLRSNGYSFQIETAYYTQTLGFRTREVPIVFRDRVQGTSKMTRAEVVEGMRILRRLWCHRIAGRGANDRMRLEREGVLPQGGTASSTRGNDLPS
jgi:glycosyltransferase involved in cell wall biosynthesis